MFATPISPGARSPGQAAGPTPGEGLRRSPHIIRLAIGVALICAGFTLQAAETISPKNKPGAIESDSAVQAKKSYSAARARYQAKTNDAEAAWHFARACFDRAVTATNNTERAKMAEEGIVVSRQLIVRDSGVVQAHYYLGMNLGQLADTKRNSAALKIVDDMEREFKAAHDLDAHFDYAGPDRNLGLLYAQAPNLVSIGSRSKARTHLRHAAELAPDYPENRLNLIEAYLRWGDRSGAWRELKALETILPEARKNLTGETWASSWVSWEERLAAIKKRLPAEVTTVESPSAQTQEKKNGAPAAGQMPE